MLELDTQQAQDVIRVALGLSSTKARFTPLGGGVSNLVYLIEDEGVRFVAKQALERLRVEEEWTCTRERLHVECAAMRALGAVLPAGAVPRIILEDAGNHILVMEAAPPGCQTWKSLLLAGAASFEVAAEVGAIQGKWLRSGLEVHSWESRFSDQTVFEDLRLAPYYRTTASRHPKLQSYFDALIEQSRRRIALVHGDLSPKNVLVSGASVTLIDFEVVHWGDPSFDMGFLFNHLLLKAFHRPDDWRQYEGSAGAYRDALLQAAGTAFNWLESGALAHLPGLLLARIDGKSPVEYITSESQKAKVRQTACRLFEKRGECIEDVFRGTFI